MDEFKGGPLVKRLIFVLLLLAGCSNTSEQHLGQLEVTIDASKKELEAFEPVTIKAIVTYDDKPIAEGADIEFELINADGKSIGSVNPSNDGDGQYSIETSFDGKGTYKIISHVSYEQYHEMPVVEVELK